MMRSFNAGRGFTPSVEDGRVPCGYSRVVSCLYKPHYSAVPPVRRMGTSARPSFTAGFTLIELLVVIAVIGILAAVVLTNLNSARARARDVQRIADVKSIQLALSLYVDSSGGKYPGTLADLAPTFIPSVPVPPPGIFAVTSYAYVPLNVGGGTCNSYHLGASLEQINNSVLTTDADTPVGSIATSGCGDQQTNKSSDFHGLNYNTHCESGTVGTAQPNGTEVCFDVVP